MTSDAQKKIDAYYEQIEEKYSSICRLLRRIYLSEGLTEELKWGGPCYSYKGLVASIGAFKSYAGTWFFKGSLLSDPDNRLRKAQKGTKGLRSLTFTSIDQVDEQSIRGFVKEAIVLNEQGITVPGLGKKKELIIPDLLQNELDKDERLKENFEKYSLSKKREFTEWIDEAKREPTKLKRLEQSIEMISKGIGRHDKYRK